MMKHYLDTDGVLRALDDDGSQDFLIIDGWKSITDGEAEAICNPPKTAEQLAQEASILRDEAMLLGAEYNGVMVSFTKDDGDGMMQVSMGFSLDQLPTVIHFKNGTKLPMTIEEFPTFALWFVKERKKFFV